MARLYASASSQAHTLAKAFLASSAGPFTVALWLKPTALSGSVKGVMGCGVDTNFWMVGYTGSTNEVQFYAEGGTGDPYAGSTFTLPSNVVTAGASIAYRYKGAASEWSRWLNGTKTVIGASTTFTLGTLTASFEIGRIYGGFYVDATIAEVAIWTTALHDEQMRELAAGVAADRVGGTGALAGYWPLRGNSSPERSYVLLADSLTAVGSPTQAAHPTIVPPMLADTSRTAWVVDLFHGSGTKRAASSDLSEDVDFDVLGAAYPSKLSGDITITDSDPTEQAGGVMQPGQVVLEFVNADGWLDRSWEWRQCPVRVREYDRTSHALVTEFVGVIVDPTNMANSDMVFTCSGADEALLETLLPRLLIEVGTAGSGLLDNTDLTELRRSDVGKPIPLVFGQAIVALPFLKEDIDTSPGGGDFLASWGTGAFITGLWFDYEATPGLEPALVFATGPGTPTSATTTTFTVTGDQSLAYTANTPVRRSGDGGVTWSYSTVASYSSGTVTINDAILSTSPTSIGLLQIGGDFSVEKTRWKFVGSATTFFTTVRFPVTPSSIVLAEVYYPTRTNPSDVIKFLLEDADQGLGQTCNAASFAQASTDFSTAGLTYAVNGSIGGDGSQRRALDVLNELCALYGTVIWKDPETAQWMIQVDAAPTVFTRTLEFGATLKNDIAEVLSVSRTSLSQAVSTLTLRYAPGGRQRGNKNFIQQDYTYRASMTVLSGISGIRRQLESQLIRPDPDSGSQAVPARVLYYRGKKLQRSDQVIRFRMLRGGRRVRRGQVFPFTIPSAGVAASFRVIARERRLNDFVFTAVGPYNADIYETNISTINASVSTPSAEAAPEDAPVYTSGVNLLCNADFSTGLKRDGLPLALNDTQILPDWLVNGNSEVTVFSLTADPRARGGNYLTVTCGTVSSGPLLVNYRDGSYSGCPAVTAGNQYLPSVHMNATATGGSATGWRFIIYWLNAAGGIESSETVARIRAVPGDVNGFGWERYYGVARAPANAVYAAFAIKLTESSRTYKIDAPQFEALGNVFGRPSDWSRNPNYGIRPTLIAAGNVTVLAPGEREHGSLVMTKPDSSAGVGVTLGTGQTTLCTAGPGWVTCITARVKVLITGTAPSWYLAIDQGGGVLTTIASSLALAANTLVSDANVQGVPIFLNTVCNVVAVPTSGAFSAGKICASAHQQQHTPPA